MNSISADPDISKNWTILLPDLREYLRNSLNEPSARESAHLKDGTPYPKIFARDLESLVDATAQSQIEQSLYIDGEKIPRQPKSEAPVELVKRMYHIAGNDQNLAYKVMEAVSQRFSIDLRTKIVPDDFVLSQEQFRSVARVVPKVDGVNVEWEFSVAVKVRMVDLDIIEEFNPPKLFSIKATVVLPKDGDDFIYLD